MSSASPMPNRKNWLSVRPRFLLACAIFLFVIVLPSAAWGRPSIQRVYLAMASLAILSAWFFILKSRETTSTWRKLAAFATSLYLAASIPIFLYELSNARWWMLHPLPRSLVSLYVSPWVHWGYFLLILGFAGSFFGRDRVRFALAIASALLLVLRFSMGTWLL